MVLLSALDAFTNPDSPWYYVVGTAFLVLIFVALGLYVGLSNKKKKRDAQNADMTAMEEKIEGTAPPEDISEPAPAENEPEQVKDETVEPVVEEQHPEPEQQVEKEPENTLEPEPVKEETKQKPPARKKKVTVEPVIKIVGQKRPQPAATTKTAPTEKPAAATKAPTQTKTASTATRKAPQKPFIDRLIAAKEAHGVYNELKNTILSYPGIKAKLTKENEQFMFGQDKKAEIALNGQTVELYLAVDSSTVPAQFGAQKAEGELPTLLKVAESKIDDAQKLIVYAMNVSMLTRNDKHRRVNYVQKAIDAKKKAQAAKKK